MEGVAMRVKLGVLLLVFISGCTKPLYEWGRYERSVHELYVDGSSANIAQERDLLARELQEAVQRGSNVPPGKYAYVGYLCYLGGDKQAAAKYFQAEKQAFPESSHFID